MVKKFTTNCDFNGQKAPVTLYVGDPAVGSHPFGFQSKWLSKDKGGSIPENIMESFAKLATISEKNRVSIEKLCAYVIDELKSNDTLKDDIAKAKELSADKKDSNITNDANKKVDAAPPASSASANNSDTSNNNSNGNLDDKK